jgi:hypothetical protein
MANRAKLNFSKPISTPVSTPKPTAMIVPDEKQLTSLRKLVERCIQQHTYASAVFYADKLTTLSKGI